MKMLLRWAFLALLLTPVLYAKEPTALRVQLRWLHQFQFAGYYAALHKGYYKEAGLEVTLIEGGPDIHTAEEVLKGNADFGVSNSSLAVHYFQGDPVVVMAPIFQHSPNILLSSAAFKSPVDLASGAKVVLMGGDQDIELKAMFLQEGIDPDRLVIVPDRNHLEGLLEGSVDAINAYSSNEPFMMDQLGLSYHIHDPRNYGLDFYGDLLFTTQQQLKHAPKSTEAFYQATLKGWEYALEHPQEIIALISERYNTQNKSPEHLAYEAKVLKKLINPEIVALGHSNIGRWKHIIETYRLFGLIKQERSLDDFFYTPQPHDLRRLTLLLIFALGVIALLGGLLGYIFRTNRRLHKSELRHRLLFANSASAGIVWREGYVITGWNIQAEALFGWSASEAIGRNFFDFLVAPEDVAALHDEVKQADQDGVMQVIINRNRTKDGRILVCEWHNTLMPQIKGVGFEAVSLAIDITQRVRHEEHLRYLAHHDPLTGLANRAQLHERLAQIRAASLRHKLPFAVAYIDLDGFKRINDTFGHEAGDLLLVHLSQRFKKLLRTEDILARLGGDEFAVILVGGCDASSCAVISERLLKAASDPVVYGDQTLAVSASIGIALFNQDPKLTDDELLRRADKAMYEAKSSGKNRYRIEA